MECQGGAPCAGKARVGNLLTPNGMRGRKVDGTVDGNDDRVALLSDDSTCARTRSHSGRWWKSATGIGGPSDAGVEASHWSGHQAGRGKRASNIADMSRRENQALAPVYTGKGSFDSDRSASRSSLRGKVVAALEPIEDIMVRKIAPTRARSHSARRHCGRAAVATPNRAPGWKLG